MIPLSDEAIGELYNQYAEEKLGVGLAFVDVVAREAEKECNRQWIEWGEEPCRTAGHHFPTPNVKKRHCEICWREIKDNNPDEV